MNLSIEAPTRRLADAHQPCPLFLILKEELNFTKAAKRAGISQPSLSEAIKSLEAKLGMQLFHRKPAVSLTPFGNRVVPYMRSIAEGMRNMHLAARLQRLSPDMSEDDVIRLESAWKDRLHTRSGSLNSNWVEADSVR